MYEHGYKPNNNSHLKLLTTTLYIIIRLGFSLWVLDNFFKICLQIKIRK